jgi:hypothetical protein
MARVFHHRAMCPRRRPAKPVSGRFVGGSVTV